MTSWEINNNYLTLKVRIPANSNASVVIPQSDPEKVLIGNIPVKESSDLIKVTVKNANTICEISSGDYIFKTSITK
jgi:3-deoxy-D-manno-octulosonic acid (KDO) 8-phosphate synthase